MLKKKCLNCLPPNVPFLKSKSEIFVGAYTIFLIGITFLLSLQILISNPIASRTISKGNELLHLGHPKVMDEQRVPAMRVYHRVKRVDRGTFYHEIEAKDIR